jgi:hypothetical protein
MLERKALVQPLSDDDLWERARFSEELVSAEAALPHYAALLERNPRNAAALVRHGQLLLDRDDPRGVEQLLAARDLDTRTGHAACAALVLFHRRHGREDEARAFEARYWALAELADLARREREHVRSDDEFLPHGLEAQATGALIAQLRPMNRLRGALLVRKHMQHFPESPLFVLAIVSDAPWWQLASGRAERELVARIGHECRFPGETLIISLRSNRAFRKPLAAVPGSSILP